MTRGIEQEGRPAGTPPQAEPPDVAALRLAGVSKAFGGTVALAEVDLFVRAGEVHALVGENGAGKSTLMAIAAGSLQPDTGTVEIAGKSVVGDPAAARRAGLAIVYQEPALLPDLTVAENLWLGVRAGLRPPWRDLGSWASGLLGRMGAAERVDVTAPVRELDPESRFLVEISKALAESPKVLVLDEPTEHLDHGDVETLFRLVRGLAAEGTAVIYISHRVREVLEVASQVTVLRNGHHIDTTATRETDERQLVAKIAGRPLAARLPERLPAPDRTGEPILVAGAISGTGFRDVDLAVWPGEIVGLAGVEGNGQREVLRALAGLQKVTGEVTTRVTGVTGDRRAAVEYVPRDRRSEGIYPDLTVRENLSARGLGSVSRLGVLSAGRERALARRTIDALRIKVPTMEADASGLSGGNQQKVVLGRVLAANPDVVLADEPSQGVDVGARFEIYTILQEAAGRGTSVVMTSSDAAELAGLCHRVIVFSRGRPVAELEETELTEHAITEAAVMAESRAPAAERVAHGPGRRARLRRSDLAPAAILGLCCLLLAGVAATGSEYFLSPTNLGGMLTLAAVVATAALGQQVAVLAGGIDLSVGPVMGMVVVVASFLLASGTGPAENGLAWVAIVAVGLVVGGVNWALISGAGVSPMIATLITYSAVFGAALILRPAPGGAISTQVTDPLLVRIGPFPVIAMAVLVVTVLAERALSRTRWGLSLRATGSDPRLAGRVGVRVPRVLLGAYVLSALGAALAGVLLMAQVGSGDPASGMSYTLLGIAAVVLGGARLGGGRGSFVGAVTAALLLQVVATTVTFFQLSADVQQWLVGLLTLGAVAVYTRLRSDTRGGRAGV